MKLTEKQRKRAEKYHELIFWVLYNFKPSGDWADWYGVLAIALCRASAHYREGSGSFAAYARKTMINTIISELRHQESFFPRCTSLLESLDYFPFPYSHYKIKNIVDTLFTLPSGEKETMMLSVSGYKGKEIAEHLTCHPSTICRLKSRAKCRIQEAI